MYEGVYEISGNTGFNVVEPNIQDDHVHLIVDAPQ